jgi:uncharacterized protein YihD (DUF1040 family)
MEISKDILNELKELSPVVAGIQKVNVFTVPNGYFTRLAEDILVGISEGDNNLLSSVPNQSAIQIPQGYFESLADNILSKIKEEESTDNELRELSPVLHSMQSKNVFAVPKNYFESLSGKILNTINKDNKEEIAATELEGLSPILDNLKDKNVFNVPQNYFELLPAKIVAGLQPQQAKVVTMRKRSITLLKYAAAAIFTGVMALGAYKFIGGNKAGIDPVIAAGQQIARENKFDDEMAKVTDTDIVKYLEENGSDADEALVANTINADELPTEEDYLTDDKALDKYLDNFNINDLKN